MSTTIGLSTQIEQIGLIIEHLRRQHEMQLFSWFCPAPLPRRRDEAAVAG
ncbi:hypothetical protein GM160_01875 [Guyparkeria halophila]|uniref:Uncharacterized protein n=1 Tax=Guyparkeria halophila TaxID=47960 RepID=A0A6I6D0Y2_9GAMM|nr:hypothetical protein [Guyparkeria halophila]QGT77737.1 hypothetical protein GM160_01875 [Guyparkeria halophila]